MHCIVYSTFANEIIGKKGKSTGMTSLKSNTLLSTFGLHLIDAAKERGISVAEMARIAMTWGITGFDLFIGFDEQYADSFLSAGMKPSVVIVVADLAHDSGDLRADIAISYAKRTGCRRIMLVPGYLGKGETRDRVWPVVMKNLSDFAARVKNESMDVVLEDFDNLEALIGSAEHLRNAFTAVPDLGLALDTGNFDCWGDDVVAATEEFLPRIRHVHLKDRDPNDKAKSVTLGTGSVPVGEIYNRLLVSGYGGWFTIEGFSAPDMYSFLEQSARYLLSCRLMPGQGRCI